MSANQLLEKALSTTSEDEAIACLRMARKKGLKLAPATVKWPLDKEIIQALHGRVNILNEEKDRVSRALQECELEKNKISDKLVNYQASLLAVVVVFGIIVLLALTL